jgi:hypothetical protein
MVSSLLLIAAGCGHQQQADPRLAGMSPVEKLKQLRRDNVMGHHS